MSFYLPTYLLWMACKPFDGGASKSAVTINVPTKIYGSLILYLSLSLSHCHFIALCVYVNVWVKWASVFLANSNSYIFEIDISVFLAESCKVWVVRLTLVATAKTPGVVRMLSIRRFYVNMRVFLCWSVPYLCITGQRIRPKEIYWRV